MAPSEAGDQLLFQGPASLFFASSHWGGSDDQLNRGFVAMQLKGSNSFASLQGSEQDVHIHTRTKQTEPISSRF